MEIAPRRGIARAKCGADNLSARVVVKGIGALEFDLTCGCGRLHPRHPATFAHPADRQIVGTTFACAASPAPSCRSSRLCRRRTRTERRRGTAWRIRTACCPFGGGTSPIASRGLPAFHGDPQQFGKVEVERGCKLQQSNERRGCPLVFEMADARIAHSRRDGERLLRPPTALPFSVERRDDSLSGGCVQIWHAPTSISLPRICAQS